MPERDPVTYAVASLMLAAIALVATAVPAFRASRLEPQAVLRGD